MSTIKELLKGPEEYAHISGRQLKRLAPKGRARKAKDMHSRADYHLNNILNLYSVDSVSRIMATWILVYEIPIIVEKMDGNIFRRFEFSCKDYIVKNRPKPYRREK